jgi:Gram-negative bacterial TonB protein C-terminal
VKDGTFPKKWCLIFCMKQFALIFLILISPSLLFSQNKQSKAKSSSKPKISRKLPKSIIISCGVCNGKAINLVKPEFPKAAKAVNVRGLVNVSVLIDENGKVFKANAYSGHPLLRSASVKAALESTFEPVKLSGKPVRVSGIIVYNFVSDNYNWLEIGNAFDSEKFAEMLPGNFVEEKQLYEQSKTADYENRISIIQSLRSSIESKLGNEPKKIWLFQTGILLKELQSNCCREENLEEKITELKTLLLNVPQNVSKNLIAKLENIAYLSENPKLNTYDSTKGNKIRVQLDDILERLSLLGN